MGNYSFNQYITKKETLDEAWPQWMGNVGQKLGLGNKSVARDTSDLLPKYSPGTQPNKTAALTPNMNNRASDYFDKLQRPRVPFSSNDLKNVINSVKGYLSSIKRIPLDIGKIAKNNHNFDGAQQMIYHSLKNTIGPAWVEMDKWVKWAEDLLTQLPKNEWGQDDVEVLTEAIKVNYRNFENMATAMKNLKKSLETWYQQTINSIANSGEADAADFANSIKLYLRDKVIPNTKAIDDQLGWLLQKIQQLMTLNNRPYSGLTP